MPATPQVLTFLVYTNYRALLYSFSAVFAASNFGPRTVGTMQGLGFGLSALVFFPAFQATVELTTSQLAGDYSAYSLCSVLLCAPLCVGAWRLEKWA